MALATDFLEHIGDTSPGQIGISIDGGRASMEYNIDNLEASDTLDAVNFFLGQTSLVVSGDGRLNRILPPAHPIMAMFYASRITNIKGLGRMTKVNSPYDLESPPMPQLALYPQLRFSVDFEPRKYPVLPDELIRSEVGSWFNWAGQQELYNFVSEWDRFCYLEPTPTFQAISAQQGTWRFRTDHSSMPDADTVAYTGVPRMYLPDSTVSIFWMQVPYRYITSPNSIINSPFIGCLNQDPFPPGGSTLNLGLPQYNPGELLYVGYKPFIYTPPVPVLSPYGDNIFSTEKLVDIEFKFLSTSRVSLDLPATNPTGNPNFVMGGFNTLPWLLDREFHLAVSDIMGTPTGASFRSFPMSLLFLDPDSPAANQITVPGR